ncbi:Vacuolar transporter chaperone 1 [Geosmithia morbida]|uniref:Vacuolar transporter chaperone 1 n=1 Tax=Geosmithia morbida TaxID=1094350 RepID=A0A9P4Z362_9HYPO|nr:Vacuolar transporter chaperone 1 [Geosmithia morbida]KAF4125789.1 Vacuolar transporter chaperone 1 [Geosmithia morbida]
MLTMIYALVTYHWRARSIRVRGQAGFDDRFGPTLLAVVLLLAVVVNFILRIADRSNKEKNGMNRCPDIHMYRRPCHSRARTRLHGNTVLGPQLRHGPRRQEHPHRLDSPPAPLRKHGVLEPGLHRFEIVVFVFVFAVLFLIIAISLVLLRPIQYRPLHDVHPLLHPLLLGGTIVRRQFEELIILEPRPPLRLEYALALLHDCDELACLCWPGVQQNYTAPRPAPVADGSVRAAVGAGLEDVAGRVDDALAYLGRRDDRGGKDVVFGGEFCCDGFVGG